jgi:hypothetical protein
MEGTHFFRVVTATSHLDLTSEKSSLYNVNITPERRDRHDMVIIFFGVVFAFIFYLTIILPIKFVIMALKLLR